MASEATHVHSEFSRRCSRCILSERFAPLTDGVCRFCREYHSETAAITQRSAEAEDRLTRILVDASGGGVGEYDAVVLFSGGKDSAYLLHRLQTEFRDLRLVALTVDNSFMSQVALANCRQIHSKMDGIDHFTIRPSEICTLVPSGTH